MLTYFEQITRNPLACIDNRRRWPCVRACLFQACISTARNIEHTHEDGIVKKIGTESGQRWGLDALQLMSFTSFLLQVLPVKSKWSCRASWWSYFESCMIHHVCHSLCRSAECRSMPLHSLWDCMIPCCNGFATCYDQWEPISLTCFVFFPLMALCFLIYQAQSLKRDETCRMRMAEAVWMLYSQPAMTSHHHWKLDVLLDLPPSYLLDQSFYLLTEDTTQILSSHLVQN